MIPLDFQQDGFVGVYGALAGWYVTVFLARLTRRYLGS